jgi:hypothetical protein
VTLAERRAWAQRLHRPDDGLGPLEIVRSLLAVQAQDAWAARLALRARGTGFGVSDVDREDGLVVTWLMRGTLHLVARDDLGWLLGLTAPTRAAGSRRRLGQLGVPPDDVERAVEVIDRALEAEGPLGRASLAERMAAAGIQVEGQATPHLLAAAAARGAIVLGGDGRFERVSPRPSPLDGETRERSLAELARRWLVAHGPATDRDLAAWSGLPLRDARGGLEAIAGELVERDGMVALAGCSEPSPRVGARLLPAFDPYVMGWRDRSFAVPPVGAARVAPGGGMLRAVATVGGGVVGTWTMPRGDVAIEWFGEQFDFAAEIADVGRFLSS